MEFQSIDSCLRRMEEEERLGAAALSADAMTAHLQLAMLYRTQMSILSARRPHHSFAAPSAHG
jgi:hypothetical protein